MGGPRIGVVVRPYGRGAGDTENIERCLRVEHQEDVEQSHSASETSLCDTNITKDS